MKKLIIPLIAALALVISSSLVSANSTTTSFDVSDRFAGAILEDGSLMMWGKNEYGEFGNGTKSTPESGKEALFEKTGENMRQIVFGTYYTSYMLSNDGVLYACGNNSSGQVGNGEYSYDGVLTPHKVMDGVVKVDAGGEYALALKSDGTLWGIGALGSLRLTNDLNRAYEPVKIYDNVKTFSCGAEFCAVITTDGKLYTAGNGAHGNLGIGKETAEDVTRRGFTYVADNMKYVSCGKYNLFAIDEGGTLYSCGNNTYGVLFTGNNGESVYDLTKVIDSGVKSAAIWEKDAVYITENGELYGTGDNLDNQLGYQQIIKPNPDGSVDKTASDGCGVIRKIADNVTDAAVGNNNILYRTADGKLYMTGSNTNIWGIVYDGKKQKLEGVAENKAVAVNSAKVITLQIGSNILNNNGTEVILDVPAQTINDRTMIPLRAIFEALGASVDWDGDTQTVTAVRGGITITLQIGSNLLYKNGEAKELDVPAQLIDGRTLVPARAVAESFGANVGWDSETATVTITVE